MPRRARIASNSGCYHVMLRGVNGSAIFRDQEDCQKFIQCLLECRPPLDSQSQGEGQRDGSLVPPFGHRDSSLVPPFGCDKGTVPGGVPGGPTTIFLYCLMRNHVHLLLKEGSEGLAAYIKRIGVRYAAYFNFKYQRRGHLFQDRFRSEPVQDAGYFLAAFRYICRNPLKAGLASALGEYEWCSYQGPAHPESYGIPAAELPFGLTPERIEAFFADSSPDIVPFRERLTDSEVEELLRSLTGCPGSELAKLHGKELCEKLSLLHMHGATIRQLERLTGLPKSNIARMLK